MLQTFKKSEKLCNFRLKKTLFEQGVSFFCYPFRIVFIPIDKKAQLAGTNTQPRSPEDLFAFPAQCLITVPGKKFKRAVDRNAIKRRVREGYRKNKAAFYTFLNDIDCQCLVAFIYTAKEIEDTSEIEAKIAVSLQKLQKQIETHLNAQKSNQQ
jgi:ribonuclease P protein component